MKSTLFRYSISTRIPLVCACLICNAIAGWLAGFLGVIIFINLLFPAQESWIASLSVLLSILIWIIYSTIIKSFSKSLMLSGIAIAISLAIVTLRQLMNGGVDILIHITIIIMFFLSLPITILCSTISVFCSSLTFNLFGNNKKKKTIEFAYRITFIAICCINSYIYATQIFTPLPNSKALVHILSLSNARYFSFACGTLFGLCILVSAWRISREHNTKKIRLLKSLATTISCWNGQSLHGHDLSHNNFTGVNFANIDLRGTSFYRTCFRGATGLDRARLDNRYFDIDRPKVQQLLTQGTSTETDFNGLNLQGAYLKQAEMPNFALINANLTLADLSGGSLRNTNLTSANLSGADLRSADLRDSILVQTDLTGADLTRADLTGACIENWNINGRTILTDVQCNYIHHKLDDTGQPTDRYPHNRNFEPGEFASLHQEVENVVELIFKEGIDWRAFVLSIQKLQIDDDRLDLQMRGIEKRDDLSVVTITHNPDVPSAVVEQRFESAYGDLQKRLAATEQEVNQLRETISNRDALINIQAGTISDQGTALKGFSQKLFGNQFNITGSTITNLAGSGQIEYIEATSPIQNLLESHTNATQVNQLTQQFLNQLQSRLAIDTTQAELIHQIILTEAENDPLFKQFILQQSNSLLATIPPGPIATAFQTALKLLQS
jgi:uncharacterized protein YjbI with pentapeptide repeats